MSRKEEFAYHKKGWFSLTGWAGAGSLHGMLLQPVSICVYKVNFD
jgi:hypothetical protein